MGKDALGRGALDRLMSRLGETRTNEDHNMSIFELFTFYAFCSAVFIVVGVTATIWTQWEDQRASKRLANLAKHRSE